LRGPRRLHLTYGEWPTGQISSYWDIEIGL
jgi:hypothetical protein